MTESVCKCCGVKWTVTSCNFHNLCQECFNKFDNTKMMNRFGNVQNYDSNLESSDFYVKCGVCDHKHVPNMLMQFFENVLSRVEQT